MVRIQCRVSRRRYLAGKRVYEYERMSLHIPCRFHNKVKPFLKQDLDMQVTTKEVKKVWWICLIMLLENKESQIIFTTYS
jgi:hypothetical protein